VSHSLHSHEPGVRRPEDAGHGRRARRRNGLTLAAGLALAYLATGFYAVQPNEQAVVRRCGRMLPQLEGPGLHFGFPYGIDQVTRVKTQELKRVGVGVGLADRSLGRGAPPQQAECLTGDRNLIVASAVVQYRIADARAFLFSAADVPALVGDTAAAAIASAVSSKHVDNILTVERAAVQDEVHRMTQRVLNRYGAGVQVTAVTLEGVAPPQEVAESFRDVAAAREDRERAVNDAQGYANRLLPQARGEAQRVRLDSEAYAEEAVRKAQGDADRFNTEAARLAAGRSLTLRRLILETMEVVLPRLSKVVIDPKAQRGLDLGIIETAP